LSSVNCRVTSYLVMGISLRSSILEGGVKVGLQSAVGNRLNDTSLLVYFDLVTKDSYLQMLKQIWLYIIRLI
jgi:hypothetical protein